MAKKCEWNGHPAYAEGPLILQLGDNGWSIFHEKTKMKIMGFKPFKQKKDALRYANNLIEKLDMNFSDAAEMFEINGGQQNTERLRNEAFWEGKDE